MPLSHTCCSCGLELCRVRAARDAVYALPVVVCPRCASASVRRRHPVSAGWRTFLRLFAAMRRLALQLVLLLVFTLIMGAFLHSLRLDLTAQVPPLRRIWEDPDAGTLSVLRRQLVRSGLMWQLMAWVCYATGLGAWLVAGFAHWRRFTAWPAWLGAMLLIFSVQAGLGVCERWIDVRLLGQKQPEFEPSPFAWTFALAVATIPLALPGAAMGVGLLAMGRAARRRAFRKSLARLRRRRQG